LFLITVLFCGTLKLAYSSTSLNGRIAGKKSTRVDLEENKTYMWCACGHSAKQVYWKVMLVYMIRYQIVGINYKYVNHTRVIVECNASLVVCYLF
jgi:hypothetical protein